MVEAAATCGADSVKSKNYSLRASSRTAHSCIPTYFQSYGLPIMRTRAFNHEGPRRGDVFVTSNFAKQVAKIEAGLREPVVYVGDLKPRRDYSDVRDIVRWPLDAPGAGRARRGLQPVLGAVVAHPGGPGLPSARIAGEGHRAEDGAPRACAPPTS